MSELLWDVERSKGRKVEESSDSAPLRPYCLCARTPLRP
jgi:hypothetical protein